MYSNINGNLCGFGFWPDSYSMGIGWFGPGGGVRFSGKWNSIWMSERTRKVDDGQGYFYQGGQGAFPPP